MGWRECYSLQTLLTQINALYPNRSKVSDGEIGDERHQQESTSGHNPNKFGVVTALDITNDPVNGPDSHSIALALIASRDPRFWYVISNGQICNSVVAPWAWRKYNGSNGHYHHVHISVKNDPRLYDITKPWDLSQLQSTPLIISQQVLKFGDVGMDVKRLQTLLKLNPDGVFGKNTQTAVIAFQKANGLQADGIVGAKTKAALGF